MKKPNKSLWSPPRFVEADGTKFEAPNWEQLIKKVAVYRRENRQPIGDVAAEAYAQFCAKKPEYCADTARSGAVATPAGAHKSILNWILSVLREFKAGRISFVSDRVAHERADKCRGCNRGVSWQGGCASCSRSIDAARETILRGDARDRSIGRLRGCGALDEDPRVSVWIEQASVDSSRVPAHCWRKA